MNDVINREYAIDAVLGIGHTAKLNDGDTVVRMSAVNYVLRNLPSAQPERKKGKWIEYDNSHCECPFCHEEWSYFDNEVEYFNFCPNCGADMREETDAD